MADYVLETKNLGISFGGLKAVQDVNLKIKKGQIYGLIGPNGAGKQRFSIFLQVFISRRQVHFTSTVKSLPAKLRKKSITRVLQEPSRIFDFSIT